MAFGVLEPSSAHQPTGTTLLETQLDGLDGEAAGKAKVILVPQPSSSPHDPLSMSRIRKELLFATIVFGACLTGVIGPLLVPGFTIIATVFKITLTQVTLLNGSLVMALGVSSYLCSCFATIYGKRIVFLFTTCLLIGTCCWGAAAQTYRSLLISRVFQGLGMGGFFALAGTASINDVFFVHERGIRVGLWNFAVIVSVNIAPIISGNIIVDLSWRWSFGLLAIFFGILLVFIVLFFPGTTFYRDSARSMSVSVSIHDNHGVLQNLHTKGEKDRRSSEQTPSIDENSGTVSKPAPVWKKLLGIQNLEVKNQARILQLCITPFLLLRHPAVIWGYCMWSVTFTWVIIQGAVADQIFSYPPYNLSAQSVGNLIGVAPLIGSALGTVFGGFSCDFFSRRMALRNKGVYEPEFRLIVIAPALITLIAGGFGLGTAVNAGLSSTVCGVFLALINFGVGVGCTGIVAYTNDACQKRAGEVFGLAMLVKSAFAFGLTFMLNDYFATSGPRVFFFTWAGLTTGVMLFTIPLYIYGKRIRHWADEVNIL